MNSKRFLIPLILLMAYFGHAQQDWVRCPDFGLPARLQTVGFAVGDRLYVATGVADGNATPLSDLQEYDPLKKTWQFRSSVPVALRGAAAFSLGKKAYITTGASTGGLNSQLFVWDQVTDRWQTLASFPQGQGRLAAVGISYGNRGFIATGYDQAERSLNDLWEYNPFSNTWIRKANLPGQGRAYATGMTVNDKVYLGLGSHGTAPLSDWYEYDPATDTWKRMADLPGFGRTGAAGFSLHGKGYVCGGVGPAFQAMNDLWEFDPVHNTWTQIEALPAAGRGYGVGMSLGDQGYVAAGTSYDGYLSELWACAPEKMRQLLIPKDDPLVSSVVISPNPFFYRFFLKMRHPYTGLLEITITSMQGQVVFRRSFNKEENYIVECWEIDYLPDGLFVFRVFDANGTVDYKQTVIHKSFGI